ncbi:hypothetical protein CK203_026891 [Vitis vinifera]|uniref:Uncharacterized protein n=1 Tax=Vitis vinifera TaxID=29760 RepID=A0A438IP76_VITVI|nr:hypothetical protein CK203_026891 [Vitis vinifera]
MSADWVCDLLKLLDVSSEESLLLTTYGKLQPPLGKHRLKIVEFISVLPTIGSEAAEKELIRLGAIQQILDLYPYNNFMHHHVENIIVSCLESKNRPLIEHLLHECNLVGKILEAEKNYTLSDDLNKGVRALLESYVEDEIFTDVSRGVSSPRLAPSLLSFRVSLADDALLGEVARYPDRRSMVFSTNKGKEVVIGEAGPGSDKESVLMAEGFEEEILVLLEKIRERKGREGQALRRASKSGSSGFERELKKLEWDGAQSRNMQILRLGRAEGEGDSRCGVLVLWDNRVLRVVGYGSWGSQSLAILRTVKMGLSGFSWGVWSLWWGEHIGPNGLSVAMRRFSEGRFVKSINTNFPSFGAKGIEQSDPKSQNAFMEEGRQFLDVVLINNEAIDSMLKRNTGCFKWISWCIFSPKFFFIVNGTPLGFFESSRGLRQGDLLSSYLFVLAMETLNCLLERAREGGFLLDLKVNGRVGVGLEVSHVLFTNDMVESGELGGVSRCDGVEESLPIYFLPLFWMLRIVRLRLEQIERDFLWGGGTLKRKHLVKWATVYSDKRKGSLVGNGRRVKFWKDKWYGDKPLSVSFRSLLALATSKEAWMSDLWSHSNGRARLGEGVVVAFGISWVIHSSIRDTLLATNPEKMRFFGVSSGLPNKIGLELAQGDPKLQRISLGLAGERKTLSTDNISLRDL